MTEQKPTIDLAWGLVFAALAIPYGVVMGLMDGLFLVFMVLTKLPTLCFKYCVPPWEVHVTTNFVDRSEKK